MVSPISLDDFHFLLSAEGQRLLAETAAIPLSQHNHLQLASRLRRQVTPSRAAAVLETILLRQRAAAKFSRAGQMYFTREGLEQASAEAVAEHRTARFARRGYGRVADLGCGIGGDAIALAESAAVVGVDHDPLRLVMARENVRVYGRSSGSPRGRSGFHPLQADLNQLPPLPVEAFFFDPARRDEHGRRLHSVHQYRPPLALADHWRRRVSAGAVKISPGVDYAELPPDAEVEFISLDGDVREALLWFGGLRSRAGRRATLLPGGHTLTDRPLADPIPVTPPAEYLYEPDGAVIRAHLVEQLAERLGATKIDADIAYLTAVSAQPTPFARCFRIEDAFPFQLKRLRAYLRGRGVGRVTVKKRGSPIQPEALQRQLRLRGDGHRILFLTHVQGEAAVLVGEEIR